MKLLITLFGFFIGNLVAYGQLTEKIETDRPDQTETPYLVPKQYFQAEMGMNTETYKNNLKQFIHPTALLKYGISNRLELRLEANYLTRTENYSLPEKTSTLLEPIELGAKIYFFEEKGFRPKTSLIVHAGLPFVADKQYYTDPVNLSFRLSMQNSLSDRVGLGYNVGIETGKEGATFFYTIAPGINIGNKWYGYIEAFGTLTRGSMEHNLDAGLAYFLSNNTKIDLSSGVGIGSSFLKNYVALGFSFRIATKR